MHTLVTSPQRGETDVLARWRSFTSFTHPMRQLPRRLMAKCAEMRVPPPHLCTQAYCKFVQIVAAHPAMLKVQEEEEVVRMEENSNPLQWKPKKMFRYLNFKI